MVYFHLCLIPVVEFHERKPTETPMGIIRVQYYITAHEAFMIEIRSLEATFSCKVTIFLTGISHTSVAKKQGKQ